MKKIDILDAYIKFGTKLFHLKWEKRKLKIYHRKNEKMVNLIILEVNPYVSKGVPQSCLDPKNKNIQNLNMKNQIACEGIEP
jgi:hypothetical protein